MEELKKIAFSKCSTENEINRLHIEFEEIEKQGMWNYFKGLIDSGKKFVNENNLFCAYLWDICDENPLYENKDLIYVQSNEMPDIDVDVEPESRNIIKQYCVQEFGENKVISIANYNTFGIKSGIRDISRVKEVPLDEVNKCTKKLEDDVNHIEWNDALEKYPSLRLFNDKYKNVCDIVRRFNTRIRSLGKHAGGIVISNIELPKTIPLITRRNESTNDFFIMSSFSEGLHRSDLKPFGLVKLDFLGLSNLNYISECMKLIKDRYIYFVFDEKLQIKELLPKYKKIEIDRDGEKLNVFYDKIRIGDKIKGFEIVDGPYDFEKFGLFRLSEEDEDWSDESYLSDIDCIKEANEGLLNMVFQFDSSGIQTLVKSGGVEKFEDLVVYNALYRPGPLDCGMTEEFVKRKKGFSKYELHDVLKPILSETHGVIVYQEQLMKLANVVGMISLPDCEKLRKAMSQKDEEKFKGFKEQFIENGQKVLNESYKYVSDLWNQLETFAGYGFNKSHSLSYSIISMRCLYLKTHFKKEYWSAVLSNLKTGDNRIGIYLIDGIKNGIKFRTVDINKSKIGFVFDEDEIIYPFNKIKGIDKESEKLVNLQPFVSFDDYIKRFGLSKTTGEILIRLGAFDKFESNRKKLEKYFEYLRDFYKKEVGIGSKDFGVIYKEISGEKTCPRNLSKEFKEKILKDNKKIEYNDFIDHVNNNKLCFTNIASNKFIEYLNENKDNFHFYPKTLNEFNDIENFSNMELCNFEKEYYSFYFHHPLQYYNRKYYIRDASKNGFIDGIITNIKTKKTKNKKTYYVINIEDENDSIFVLFWQEQFLPYKDILYENSPIRVSVVENKKFRVWNLSGKLIVKRLRRIDEISEEEENKIKNNESFSNFIEQLIQ